MPRLATIGITCALALVLLAAGAWAGYRYALSGASVEQRGADLIDRGEHLALLIGRASAEARRAEDASRRAIDEWREYRIAVERRDDERRGQYERLSATVDSHLSGITRLADGIDGDLDLAVRCLTLVDILVAGLDELRRNDGRPP